MKNFASNIISYFFEILFPPICYGCQKMGVYLCKTCKKQIKPHPELCPFCHRPTKYRSVCLDCKSQHRHLEGIIVGFIYTDTIKKLISALKRSHRYHIASFLAERLLLVIQSHESLGKIISPPKNTYSSTRFIPPRKLIITSVPTHRRKKWFIRGYSQSECLARTLAKSLNISYQKIFTKTRYTTSQTKLSRTQRLTNLTNSFSLQRKIYIQRNDIVLIIDDITTTGATIDQLAQKLKLTYPTITIWGVVVGRHGK